MKEDGLETWRYDQIRNGVAGLLRANAPEFIPGCLRTRGKIFAHSLDPGFPPSFLSQPIGPLDFA